ncbi:VC0807 family protein [Streptomyces hawaiiensis]|uniref:VC0807 family protein n=1 Tax=Streptomyces hawaiiensis TaxID=67305 RepID=UPI00365FFA44
MATELPQRPRRTNGATQAGTEPQTEEAEAAAAQPREERNPRTMLIKVTALDMALPLLLYYGLRMLGMNQWLALVISGALPLARLAYQVVRERKVERMTLFSLSIIVTSTLVSLLTGDPRLVLARESYFTALVGLWMLSTLLAKRPFLYAATIRILPEATARSWREDWENSPDFRKAMRLMTAAWGAAFLIDAVARVVMAYTLPVDSVPLLGAGLLVVMLIAVVQFSKAYAKRLAVRLGRPGSA